MSFQYSLKSDIGRRRKQNQDRGVACPEIGLFVVADGMGGHQGGEIASEMVITIVPDQIRKSRTKNWSPREALIKSFHEANDAIHERAQKEARLYGMGTTASAILFDQDTVYIAQVGDSRCYLIQPDQIWQLTRDHSLVQEKFRAGLISREQIKSDQYRNVITRSVGFEANVNVDLFEMEYNENYLFLLCSDGLSGPVDDAQILSIVSQNYFQGRKDLAQATEGLINQANAGGGDDNITVLIARGGK